MGENRSHLCRADWARIWLHPISPGQPVPLPMPFPNSHTGLPRLAHPPLTGSARRPNLASAGQCDCLHRPGHLLEWCRHAFLFVTLLGYSRRLVLSQCRARMMSLMYTGRKRWRRQEGKIAQAGLEDGLVLESALVQSLAKSEACNLTGRLKKE